MTLCFSVCLLTYHLCYIFTNDLISMLLFSVLQLHARAKIISYSLFLLNTHFFAISIHPFCNFIRRNPPKCNCVSLHKIQTHPISSSNVYTVITYMAFKRTPGSFFVKIRKQLISLPMISFSVAKH